MKIRFFEPEGERNIRRTMGAVEAPRPLSIDDIPRDSDLLAVLTGETPLSYLTEKNVESTPKEPGDARGRSYQPA